MRMFSKSKPFWCTSQLQARLSLNTCRKDYANNRNIVGSLLHDGFCTVSEPLRANNISPAIDELRGLVMCKPVGGDKSKNDDFVPHTVKNWIDNHKTHVHAVSVNDNDHDKISKILKERFESPSSVVKALDGCGVDVSESLVDQVLRRFSRDWIHAFGFFKWANLTHSAALYNLMVDILGRANKFGIMWELMEEMKKLEGCITVDTMIIIMRHLAKAGKFDDAINAFQRMEVFGVEKNITAMNVLMRALVKEGRVEHAERLYIQFKDLIPPTTETYNVLVHGWCKSRQIGKARKTVDEMKKCGISPNMTTYTSFIEVYCQERDYPKVDATLEEMKKNGCPPNPVTYTLKMTALSKSKDTDKALEVYKQMKKDKCAPVITFYNILIHTLSQAGRLEDSVAVFEDMSKLGVVPDVTTYNTLIHIAAKNSEEERALNLLKKMEENQCRPDIKTYAPLLKMCCVLKRMKVLSFLLDHMMKNGVSLDLGAYSLLVSRLVGSGNLDRACYFFEEMVLKGFVPMRCTYDILVKGLEKNGMSEAKKRAEELMSRAKEPGFSHSC